MRKRRSGHRRMSPDNPVPVTSSSSPHRVATRRAESTGRRQVGSPIHGFGPGRPRSAPGHPQRGYALDHTSRIATLGRLANPTRTAPKTEKPQVWSSLLHSGLCSLTTTHLRGPSASIARAVLENRGHLYTPDHWLAMYKQPTAGTLARNSISPSVAHSREGGGGGKGGSLSNSSFSSSSVGVVSPGACHPR